MKKAIVLLFMSLASMSGSLVAQSDGDASVLNYIEEANKSITSLLSDGKFDEAGKYFASDMVQIISGQPPINGREAWIQTQKMASQIGNWDLALETVAVEVDGDIAVERGIGVQTFTANDKSPMPSFVATGDYMVMWTKVEDKWIIQWDYVVLRPADPGE